MLTQQAPGCIGLPAVVGNVNAAKDRAAITRTLRELSRCIQSACGAVVAGVRRGASGGPASGYRRIPTL